MSKTMCPGQDTAFWRAGDVFDVECSGCGAEVEFFKDDSRRRCRNCGQLVANPKLNLGCAMWCEHAKDCLGYDPKEKLGLSDPAQESLVDRLIAEMKKVFGSDQKRITHALTVLENAQSILKKEGGDPKVVVAAAVLHDIGIREAERKHGSNAGRFQEMEGPAIARPIMENLKLDPDTVDHVEKIIANHHSAKDIDTREFRILWDADWLVNLPEEFPDKKGEELSRFISKVFKTETGKEMAQSRFL